MVEIKHKVTGIILHTVDEADLRGADLCEEANLGDAGVITN